jgi:hypothetical protein
VHMSKEDLLAEPAGTTDCPYVEVGVPVRSHNSNQPQVKRLKVENLMGKLEEIKLLHISYFVYFISFYLILKSVLLCVLPVLLFDSFVQLYQLFCNVCVTVFDTVFQHYCYCYL